MRRITCVAIYRSGRHRAVRRVVKFNKTERVGLLRYLQTRNQLFLLRFDYKRVWNRRCDYELNMQTDRWIASG